MILAFRLEGASIRGRLAAVVVFGREEAFGVEEDGFGGAQAPWVK